MALCLSLDQFLGWLNSIAQDGFAVYGVGDAFVDDDGVTAVLPLVKAGARSDELLPETAGGIAGR